MSCGELALPVPKHWHQGREGWPLGLGVLRTRQRGRRDGLQAVAVEERRVPLVQEHGGAGQALAAGVPGTALLPFCSARLAVHCQHSGTQDTHEEPQGGVWFHLSAGVEAAGGPSEPNSSSPKQKEKQPLTGAPSFFTENRDKKCFSGEGRTRRTHERTRWEELRPGRLSTGVAARQSKQSQMIAGSVRTAQRCLRK